MALTNFASLALVSAMPQTAVAMVPWSLPAILPLLHRARLPMVSWISLGLLMCSDGNICVYSQRNTHLIFEKQTGKSWFQFLSEFWKTTLCGPVELDACVTSMFVRGFSVSSMGGWCRKTSLPVLVWVYLQHVFFLKFKVQLPTKIS